LSLVIRLSQDKETGLARGLIIVLGILAGLSLLSMGVTVDNYVQKAKLARSLKVELGELSFEEEKPRVVLDFQLINNSLSEIWLEDFSFNLYLNGNFMGSSDYVPFASITLSNEERTELKFEIDVRSPYLRYIQKAKTETGFSWLVQGMATWHPLPRGRSFQRTIRARWEN